MLRPPRTDRTSVTDPQSNQPSPQDARSQDLQQRLSAARTRATSMFRALPSEVHDLGTLFEEAGQELAMVGGPVRDAVLGRSSADLDFTTSALPDQTEEILRRWTHGRAIWDMGREFGTLGATRDGVKVEITTYRTESYDPASRVLTSFYPHTRAATTLDRDPASQTLTLFQRVAQYTLQLAPPAWHAKALGSKDAAN